MSKCHTAVQLPQTDRRLRSLQSVPHSRSLPALGACAPISSCWTAVHFQSHRPWCFQPSMPRFFCLCLSRPSDLLPRPKHSYFLPGGSPGTHSMNRKLSLPYHGLEGDPSALATQRPQDSDCCPPLFQRRISEVEGARECIFGPVRLFVRCEQVYQETKTLYGRHRCALYCKRSTCTETKLFY